MSPGATARRERAALFSYHQHRGDPNYMTTATTAVTAAAAATADTRRCHCRCIHSHTYHKNLI